MTIQKGKTYLRHFWSQLQFKLKRHNDGVFIYKIVLVMAILIPTLTKSYYYNSGGGSGPIPAGVYNDQIIDMQYSDWMIKSTPSTIGSITNGAFDMLNFSDIKARNPGAYICFWTMRFYPYNLSIEINVDYSENVRILMLIKEIESEYGPIITSNVNYDTTSDSFYTWFVIDPDKSYTIDINIHSSNSLVANDTYTYNNFSYREKIYNFIPIGIVLFSGFAVVLASEIRSIRIIRRKIFNNSRDNQF